MFSYSMVAKEIEMLFEQAGFTKTAAFEAMMHANNMNEDMCAHKIKDLEAFTKQLQQKITDLKNKIEYIKQHP